MLDWIGGSWGALGLEATNTLVSMAALSNRLARLGRRTWRRIIAVWRRHVRIVPCRTLAVAGHLLRGECSIVLATLLSSSAGVGGGWGQIHRRVPPHGAALLLLHLLQKLLGLPMLMVHAPGAIFGLIGVCVLHVDITVAIVVLGASALQASGGGQRHCIHHRVRPRELSGRGVRILLYLRLHVRVPLRLLGCSHVVGSVPRLAAC
jgi:hypothetical protein